ncbi:MAG: trimeric autotransporter adhesin [Frankiaceae bacterium]|jgi:hypothetical protein|nr:trimeric autotransporter adhesin [Frankiaceae bacterium]
MLFGRTLLRTACATATLAVACAVVAAPSYADDPAPAGPSLVAVTVDPAEVDVSTSPAVVTVSAHVTGAETVAVNLGTDPTPTSLQLASGDTADGTWSGVVTVPAFTPHGPLAAHVTATDAAGTPMSTDVDAALLVLDAVPAAPASVTVSPAGQGALDVSWTAPPANGGSGVDSYDVAAEPAPGSDPAAVVPAVATLGSAARSVPLAALSAGTRYVVRVTAHNTAGTGTAAQADATTAPPLTVTDAPGAVATVPGNASLSVQWLVPASDGGSAVTGYAVSATPRTSGVPVPPVVSATASPVVLPGLVNGVTYDVAVTAANGVGSSLPGTAYGTPRTVPGAPAVVSVTAGDAAAVVRWTPPVSNGGAAVESYTVTAGPGRPVVTVPGYERAANVTQLANGLPVTFTVVAVNAAGPGTASAPSVAVIPRRPGRLVVVTQPKTPVVTGTRSTVVAALTTTVGGIGISGQQVELMARVKPATTWKRVAVGTTGSNGRVTLSATLPASADLRLHHAAGAVSAADVAVRSVAVSIRVNAPTSAARVRVGMTIVVRGSVGPAKSAGAPVYLQGYVRGAWRTVASGRMTSRTAYQVSWKPGSAAAYALRVVKPSDAANSTGTSGQWRQYVDPENAADVARAVLGNRRITLETTHDSGVRDLATARQNVVDVAAGRLARRSSYQNAPGGYTSIDIRLLRAIRAMGAAGTVTVSEIAGGSHAPGSMHYSGHGLDINWVNGAHVGRGAAYGMAINACRANGAVRVFSPSYDPYGGHGNHVHCDW